MGSFYIGNVMQFEKEVTVYIEASDLDSDDVIELIDYWFDTQSEINDLVSRLQNNSRIDELIEALQNADLLPKSKSVDD